MRLPRIASYESLPTYELSSNTTHVTLTQAFAAGKRFVTRNSTCSWLAPTRRGAAEYAFLLRVSTGGQCGFLNTCTALGYMYSQSTRAACGAVPAVVAAGCARRCPAPTGQLAAGGAVPQVPALGKRLVAFGQHSGQTSTA